MNEHHLSSMFDPQSIAIIGASDTPFSLGQIVFANLMAGQYKGQLYPVNLKRKMVGGMQAFRSVTKIKDPVDLAIVLTPVHTYLNIIQECAQKKIHALLLNNGADLLNKKDEEILNQALRLAKEKKIRILGPSFLGMMRPVSGLNASSYSCQMFDGSLALVSQSSSLATAIVDWAERKEVGFSSVITADYKLSDVDFGDILDFLAYDSATQAVLLQVQNVTSGRSFLSALKSLARVKPVVVIKSGSSENDISGVTLSSKVIDSHRVFQGALRRTGALFISTVSEIFTSINALSNNFKVTDKRLALISNGIGVGTLAKDRALRLDVEIADLTDETATLLNQTLPMKYRAKEPIDLLDNASPVLFKHVAQLCLEDKNVDGVLVILTPQMGTDHLTTARLMVELQKQTKKPLYLSWLGEAKVNDSYVLFSKEHSACFRMPEHAIEAFKTLVDYQKSQKLLFQIPLPPENESILDEAKVKKIIDAALKEKISVLPEHLAQELLRAYSIPAPSSLLITSVTEAKEYSQFVGFPLSLKVDAPDLVGVIEPDIYSRTVYTETELEHAYEELMGHAKKNLSTNAVIYGINIRTALVRKANQEAMISVVQDKTFGPVIGFGESMYMSESRPDYAVAVPPLNEFLAQDLIAQTYIGKNANLPKRLQLANNKELKQILLMLSQLVADFPQISEICLNPVWVEDKRVIIPNVQVVLRKFSSARQNKRFSHMAIMPYPAHMSMSHKLPNGANVVIRPLVPEDAPLLQNMVKNLSEESRFFRYMSNIKQLSQNLLVKFTQFDYDKEMAFAMIHSDNNGNEQMLGVARYSVEPDSVSCEFAVEVLDGWQNNGIGTILMQKLFIAAKEQGLEKMHGEVLNSNEQMKHFVKKMGFSTKKSHLDQDLIYADKTLSTASDMMTKANLLANKMMEKINSRNNKQT